MDILIGLSVGERAWITAAYDKQKIPRDQLPYSREFDGMYHDFIQEFGGVISQRTFWLYIIAMAKAGMFQRKT